MASAKERTQYRILDWQQPNATELPHLDLKTQIEIKSPHISSGINLSVEVSLRGNYYSYIKCCSTQQSLFPPIFWF